MLFIITNALVKKIPKHWLVKIFLYYCLTYSFCYLEYIGDIS